MNDLKINFTVEVLCFHRVFHDVQDHESKQRYWRLDLYWSLYPFDVHGSVVWQCREQLQIRSFYHQVRPKPMTLNRDFRNLKKNTKLGNSIRSKRTLGNDIRLNITIVVLTSPNETTSALQRLSNHIYIDRERIVRRTNKWSERSYRRLIDVHTRFCSFQNLICIVVDKFLRKYL